MSQQAIQQYDISIRPEGVIGYELDIEAEPDGEWVKSKDFKAHVEELQEERLDLAKFICSRKDHDITVGIDHACEQCVGEEAMGTEFVCALHRSRAIVKAAAKGKS